jgi:transketolase
MHYHSEKLVLDLTRKAQLFRMQVLEMVFRAQTGHLGGAFSSAEILTALYFHHLNIDPKQPDWSERDRFLFSKGHACAMLYTVLAHRGFFPVKELETFRQLDSRLQGHPDHQKLPGIEISAGPLGHGIPIGVGMALALIENAQKSSSSSAPSSRSSRSSVYVLVGDGEINAGVVWEGAMAAAKFRLGNLTAILDYNGIQQTGATADVMPTECIADKWRSFGWHVLEVDGHSIFALLSALDLANEIHAKPTMIVARTTKGKGVSFMEYNNHWHGAPPNIDQYQLAQQELQEELQKWEK